MAKKIKDISGNGSEIKIKKKGMNKEYTCNNARLMKEMSEKMTSFKFTPIEQSLKELYAWYNANKESIKKDNLLRY
jgi:GDP-L-fucose synthase